MASIDRLVERNPNVKDTLRALIAQETIELLENFMHLYTKKLEDNYQVWALNTISFERSDKTSTLKIFDTVEKTKMFVNFSSNNHTFIQEKNFSHINVQSNLKEKRYDEIKKECIEKSKNVVDFNQSLKEYRLTSRELIDTIKKYRRKSSRIAEVLTQQKGVNITTEKLGLWIDKMYEIDPSMF